MFYYFNTLWWCRINILCSLQRQPLTDFISNESLGHNLKHLEVATWCSLSELEKLLPIPDHLLGDTKIPISYLGEQLCTISYVQPITDKVFIFIYLTSPSFYLFEYLYTDYMKARSVCLGEGHENEVHRWKETPSVLQDPRYFRRLKLWAT